MRKNILEIFSQFRKLFFPYSHEEPMPGRWLVIAFVLVLFILVPALLFLMEYLFGYL